jgi:hypothetical protein
MLKTSKEKAEEELYDMLHEALRSFNQEDGIQSLTVDVDKETCTVVLSVVEVDDDNYIGFDGY